MLNITIAAELGRNGLPNEIRIKGVENLNWALQTVAWFDGAYSAISKQAFFADTILLYTEKYDLESWWASQYIMILKANYYYPNQILKNNQYMAFSTQSSDYIRGNSNSDNIFATRRVIYAHLLDEYGINSISISQGEEIKQLLPPIDHTYRNFINKAYLCAKLLLDIFISFWPYAAKKLLKLTKS